MFWLLTLIFVFWTIILVDFQKGFKTLPSIDHLPFKDEKSLISIIIAAKDEEKSIKQTVETLLEQKYVNLEILAVNDRSTDSTGSIIENLADQHANVHAITIESLPSGWLGKNHALHIGAQQSKGTYLLFTDADIYFHENVVSKAVTYLKNENLDHLTAAPNLRAGSFFLKGLISFFLFGFGYLKRPWTANHPSQKGGMGVGAFQLLTKACYEGIGGHHAIRFRPDDDLAMGLRIKKAGYRQNLVTALRSLSVEWYPDLPSAFKGFEKNAFAGLNYSVLFALLAIAGVFTSQILPFITIWSSHLPLQIVSAFIIGLLFYLYALTTRHLTTYSKWIVLGLPIFAVLFIYMLSRALVLTFLRGGIEWRGSRYSLKELKKYYRNSKEE
ncbi:glycosyltransferase [Halobacillus halophilus]|uniref:glycosyltransferase n=1 Tax=Halobacillus halophilus TaxID=1570 RepID=UPI001CD36C5B|nr:glycosyltransferase family 2 protein [Halobacillus halophilus]MCA1009595.1 glycosyltransferase [Halobacillus halophilus]